VVVSQSANLQLNLCSLQTGSQVEQGEKEYRQARGRKKLGEPVDMVLKPLIHLLANVI